jgi:hypothetical protein
MDAGCWMLVMRRSRSGVLCFFIHYQGADMNEAAHAVLIHSHSRIRP